ncbi:MAG: hypothetical protein HN802_05005 [Candidatus Jacksonbacteria bacterium]|mgnify:FL=1|jgi:hypothetical protein|nr:hypothetical protein [Candidatus Jacksonbacteria bacterium]
MSVSREALASKAREIANEYYSNSNVLSEGALSSEVIPGKTVTATLLRCELTTSTETNNNIWEDTGELATESVPKMHAIVGTNDYEYIMMVSGIIEYSLTGLPTDDRIMETFPLAINDEDVQGSPPTYWNQVAEYTDTVEVFKVVKEALSDQDWQMLVDAGKIPAGYENVSHSKESHGNPKESEDEESTIPISVTVPEKGEWFSDDHKDAVIAAAVYELLKDQIDALTARVESLEP